VGQGDATLIVADTGETLLVDAGRSKTRIRERLQTLGIEDLDAILATHPDADHIAGLIEVLDLYDIERYYHSGDTHTTQTYANLLAAVDAEDGLESFIVARGDTITLGSLTIEVLHPGTLTGDNNVDSIVLLLSCGEVDVLLMADAETPSEQEMLVAGVLGDVEVLKVGHHGSRSSTSQAFLDVVSPEFGVISAGLDSQYGHPHAEVVELLEGFGVELILTDTTVGDDTVVLESDCEAYSFTS